MCGLFGAVIQKNSAARAGLSQRVAAAHAVQAHRGPDMNGEQQFELDGCTVVLAHQRLSILDLSEHGRQPMASHVGQQHIIYNGEIYNYREIKATHGYTNLTSSSDTEVILERLSQSDTPADAFGEFNGMWAIAMLDAQKQTLTLSRDRAGIKPLYYTLQNGDLYFASEIKTLLALSGLKFPINRATVARYVEQSLQDDTNETFFDGIMALPAGSFATLNLAQPVTAIHPISYWDPFTAKANYDYSTPEQTFRELFESAVRLRLRSDVPVGVTLSGGLDSSLITHAMRTELGHSNFTVLSAVAPGQAEDESKYIDIMRDAYGLKVTKIAMDWKPEDALALLAKATWCNDSPLGSFSNVAFYLLMQAARAHEVKVILSGQGADEMLCGYKKFVGFYAKHLIRQKHYLRAAFMLFSFVLNGTVLRQFSLAEAKRYFSKARGNSLLTPETLAQFTRAPIASIGSSLSNRQWLDYRKFSVPFLTHYEDRMSMVFGREIRLPYLDYRLVEFLLNAPDSLKIRHGWTKWLMRSAYSSALPKAIIWRKDKQGFVNPQAQWLRNELRPEIETRFGEGARIYRYGLIDKDTLQQRYRDYCAGKPGIWYREIFAPLALDMWLEQFETYIAP